MFVFYLNQALSFCSTMMSMSQTEPINNKNKNKKLIGSNLLYYYKIFINIKEFEFKFFLGNCQSF